jgi:superfamily I DNA/RNA helicase
VRAPISSSRIIIGGPGSGKSLVLVHRAHFAVKNAKLPVHKVTLLTYTNRLKAELVDGLSKLGLEQLSVSTFDALCKDLHKQFLPGKSVPSQNSTRGVLEVRKNVLKALEDNPIQPLFEFCLVDESQDLDETSLLILKRVSKSSTLAMDVRQQLYGTGMNPKLAAKTLGLGVKQQTLLNAYRCTPNIVKLASIFLNSEEEIAEFQSANLLSPDDVETPKVTIFESDQQKMDSLRDAIVERGQLGQSTLILGSSKSWVKSVVDDLGKAGVNVVSAAHLSAAGNLPEVVTYHSAKGLTVDSVFLPDLDSLIGDKFYEAPVANLLFVAVTRATHYVWIGLKKDSKWRYLSQIEALEKAGVVQIVHASTKAPTEQIQTVDEDDDWEV